jgi:hypothetical protein
MAGRSLVTHGDMPRSSRGPPCGRAEPAPPRGGPSEGKMALRGKPGDNARRGFLGGARSPRPGGKARRMPRHTGSHHNLPLPVCKARLSRVTRRTKRVLGVGLSKVAKGPHSKATTTGGRRWAESLGHSPKPILPSGPSGQLGEVC